MSEILDVPELRKILEQSRDTLATAHRLFGKYAYSPYMDDLGFLRRAIERSETTPRTAPRAMTRQDEHRRDGIRRGGSRSNRSSRVCCLQSFLSL